MKIYRLEKEFRFDPQSGLTNEVIVRSPIERIAHPKHGEFEASSNGTFDVPEEFGAWLCSTPGWHAGESPFPAEESPKRRTRKPDVDEEG